MPIIKSAKKALRVSIRREEINDVTRAKIKSAVKGVKVGVKNTDNPSTKLGTGKIDDLLSKAYRELDIAAKKNVIHKNKASRLKSRLAQSVAKVEVATEKAPRKKIKKTK